ncbi:MAG: hypothetical protein CL927_09515 [Deltaproteobacteria bacterium]|nr:hypothetical protein [Deltaproteobacteria bacterium]HCH66370.1 hypothetical protein [Deltaproteobacteria bacterium]
MPRSFPRRSFLVAAGGALVVLHPAWANPLRYVPGHPLSDVSKHVWSYWHTPATLHSLPQTDLLNGPHGGVLLDPMAMPALLLAPLSALASPALAANVWIAAMLIAAGLGVARLARVLGATEGGAALAAGMAVFSAPLLAYPVVAGVHERLGVALIPWLVAALLERAKHGRGGFVPAILLVPLALHSGVWAWVGVLLMGAAVALPRTTSWIRFWAPWGLGGLLLVAAFALSQGWSSDPMSLAPQPGRHGLFGPGGAVVRAASFQSLWWPSPPLFVDEGDLLMRGEHVGLVATLLAGSGVVLRRRSAPWIWLSVVLVVLGVWSLGPWLWGHLNSVYAVSVWVVPLLGAWPEPGQLTMPLVLLLVAAAGAAWSTVPQRSVRGLLVVMLVAERWMALPPLGHRTDTQTESVWAALPGEGVIATIPRNLPSRQITPGRPFLAQIAHEQPITASVFPGVSRWDDWSVVADGRAADWNTAAECFRRGGIRYLAMHSEWMGEGLEPAIQQLSSGTAVEVGRSPTWVVFDLRTEAGTGTPLPPFRPKGAAPAPSGWLPPAPLPVGVHTVNRRSDVCPVDRLSAPGP